MKSCFYFELCNFMIKINIISALITIFTAIIFVSGREIIYREFQIKKRYPDNRVLASLPIATNIILVMMVFFTSITISSVS